jgi:hypothetical protein
VRIKIDEKKISHDILKKKFSIKPENVIVIADGFVAVCLGLGQVMDDEAQP